MISRYSQPDIAQIWSEQSKFKTYLEVELALLEALAEESPELIGQGLAQTIREKAKISPDRIKEIESITHHDIIAFCTSITEQLEPKEGKFFHYGVTSSDIIDTATSLQIKRSLEIQLTSLKELLSTLRAKAEEVKELMTLGRSHGMWAEPMSFGQKILGHFAEFKRRYQELEDYYRNDFTGQISGAVGNYAIVTPSIEKKVLSKLGLNIEPVSTQVIPRDRIAKLISINALCAGAIERLAVEIRHLHRSEVDELHEGFRKGQKGSSTMPHKKNPISGENLTGMARLIRSHWMIANENIILWHERDISHSAPERIYLPEHFELMVYSLRRLNSTIANLNIHHDKIQNRVLENEHYLSSYYLHYLLAHTDLTREQSYSIVQSAAFQIKENPDQKFTKVINELLNREGLSSLDFPQMNSEVIKSIYLKHASDVFTRTLSEE